MTDTPKTWGTYTYTAHYTGDATYAPSTYAVTVTATPLRPTLSLATGATTVNYEPMVHVTGHLGTTYTNRTVSIYAQTLGSTAKTLVKTGAVDSHGNLTVSYLAAHSTTFSAVFAATRSTPRNRSRARSMSAPRSP